MIVRPIRSFVALVTSVVLYGIGLTMPARASDDPLLFLVAAPTLQLSPLPKGALGATLTVGESIIPDPYPRLRDIRFDPQAVVLAYRRIDGSLRPWRRLTNSTPPVELAEGDDQKAFSFGAMPAGYGATYELNLNYADALAWLPGGPSPRPSEYSGVLEIWGMGAKRCRDDSAAATVAAARATTIVITIPSQPVATPDIDLRAVRRSFEHRAARIVRGTPIVFSSYGNPHACDYATPLKRGDRITISSIARDPLSSAPAATSVGPLGVSAAAAIPKGTPRLVPQAIRVELGSVPFRGEAEIRELIFASPEELRYYLARD